MYPRLGTPELYNRSHSRQVPENNVDEFSLFRGKMGQHSRFSEFHSCTLRCKVSRRELFTIIPSLALEIALFRHYRRFMTTGEDRNKHRLNNGQLCGVWKLPFCHHRPIKLTQNCIWFTKPCIDLLAWSSVTREYHPKVLELLNLLQYTAAYWQCTLAWVSGKTHNLSRFCADFHSSLVARSWKPTKCMLMFMLRRRC